MKTQIQEEIASLLEKVQSGGTESYTIAEAFATYNILA